MMIDVGDLAAGDDRHRAAHLAHQKGQRRQCLRLEPHRVGPLGDLDQGAVEIEKEGVTPAIDREGQNGALGHWLERNCNLARVHHSAENAPRRTNVPETRLIYSD